MNPFRMACVALLLSTATGCMGFRGGEISEVSPWPPAPLKTKKSVSLVVSGQMTLNDKPGDVSAAMLSNWREAAQRTYTQSGLFQNVVGEGAPADIRAEVRVTDTGHGSQVLAFISGLTLTLLPARAEDRLTVRTQFKNKKGDVLATYEKSESVTVWFQLLLAFGMPFSWPPTAVDEAFRDLHQATLAEAHAKGIL